MPNMLTMIDLFAGCGGLSLGFEEVGFKPLLFSEINTNAAQTYLLNRKGEGVIPYGDIYSLTNENLKLLKENWKLEGVNDIDLIAGGPPCQGYSGIGHRRTFKVEKQEIPSNHLFQEMVRVIKYIKPKVFLFENVKGLLSGRWTKNGEKGEIFKDVLAAFEEIEGYECGWDLLYAKNYGVPQNRPRVFIVGYRKDVLDKYRNPSLNLNEPVSIYASGGNGKSKGFLPTSISEKPPTLKDLLSDLVDIDYLNKSETKTYPQSAITDIQRYLRKSKNGSIYRKGAKLTEHEYSKHSDKVINKFKYMLQNNGDISEEMKTKKFAQRLLPKTWGENGPNITATSLPDDYIHFLQPRVPTVREWARIQTFPDWYQFSGPRTTGGRRRAGDPDIGLWEREVPKYTQIGNAVPVLLAKNIASHIKKIIES